MNTQVSVVIPTYNSQETIERALKSVLDQSMPVKEIIVIDDASTDRTFEILQNFKTDSSINLKIFRNETNQGPSKTRNRGIELSQGNWLAFLDSDDWWHPQKLKIQLEVAQKNECFFIGTLSNVGNISNQVFESENVKWRTLTLMDFYWKNHFQTPTVVIKNDQSIRFDESMKYAEDFQLWLCSMKNLKKAILIEEKLTFLGKPSFGVSGLSKNLVQMEKGELRALDQITNPVARIASKSLSILKFFRRVFLSSVRCY